MKKNLLLSTLFCSLAMVGMAENREKPTFNKPFVQPGQDVSLYLYNVGAGQFFCDGNDWGTHASVGEKGILMMPVATEETNGDDAAVYLLRSYPASKGYWCNVFFTNDNGVCHLYTDGDAEKPDPYFCFESLEDNTFKIYAAHNNNEVNHSEPFENFFVAVDPEYVNSVNEQKTGTGILYLANNEQSYNIWGWVSQEDYAEYLENLRIYYHAEELNTFIQQAEELGIDVEQAQAAYENLELSYDEISAAITGLKKLFLEYYQENVTPNDAVDLTSYLQNPSFEASLDGWTNEVGTTTFEQGNWDAMIDGNSFTGSKYLNLWNGEALTGDIIQTLTGMPNGVYQLTAGAYSDATGGYIFLNDAKVAVTMGDTSEESKGQDYSVVTIVADGTLRFGYHSEHQGNFWSCIDNFRLTYYGDGEDAYTYWVEQSIEGAPDFSYARCQKELIDNYDQALTALKGADTSEDVSTYISNFVDALNAVKANINAYNKLENTVSDFELNKEKLYDYYIALAEKYIEEVVNPAIDSHNLATEGVVEIQDSLNHIILEGYSSNDLFNELSNLMDKLDEAIAIQKDKASAEALEKAQNLYDEINKKIVEDVIENNDEIREYIKNIREVIYELNLPTGPGTDEEPVSYSIFIQNNDFENGTTGWKREGQISTFETASWGIDQTYLTGNAYLNLWDAAPKGSISQTLKDLPAGIYKLTVSAFSNCENCMVIFAGKDNEIVEVSSDISGVKTYEVVTRVTDGTLHLGIILYGEGEAWCVADNFELYSYGEDSLLKPNGNKASEILPDDISQVKAATSNHKTIFDMSGRRVSRANLKPGLYILNGRKVLVK